MSRRQDPFNTSRQPRRRGRVVGQNESSDDRDADGDPSPACATPP